MISPEEGRRRFSRLSVAVVVAAMVAELVINCCRAAACAIREALSLKLLGESPALDRYLSSTVCIVSVEYV